MLFTDKNVVFTVEENVPTHDVTYRWSLILVWKWEARLKYFMMKIGSCPSHN